MAEIKRVSEALRAVERYENYLFRKAWGKTLVLLGVVVPLSGLLILWAQPLSVTLGVSVGVFIIIIAAVALIIGFGGFMFLFASAIRAASKNRRTRQTGKVPRFVAIFLTWFIVFTLRPFAPYPLQAVSMLWATAVGFFGTYFILRTTAVHATWRELPIMGLILLVASASILMLSDVTLEWIATLLVYATSLITGGFFAIVTAPAALESNR